MRVPIPVVIPLCLGVVGGVWWTGTRDRDFLTPPSEQRLAVIRAKVAETLPPADHSADAAVDTSLNLEGQKTPTAEDAVEPRSTQSANEPVNLAEYREQSAKNAGAIVTLARQLEIQGEIQHALLAWERVIDSATVNEAGKFEAIRAVKRLRPELPAWNKDATATIAITLHVGAGRNAADLLAPLLGEITDELGKASSGILRINSELAVGNDMPTTLGSPPVAIWLSGSTPESRSTEVLAFTIHRRETLRNDVLATVFKLIRSYLERNSSLKVTDLRASSGETPMDAIGSHITRLGWRELGSQLNKPLE